MALILALAVAGVTSFLVGASPSSAGSIELWVRSFISQPEPLRMLNTCFGTDNRPFSAEEDSTSRVETRLQVFWENTGENVDFHIHRSGDKGTRSALVRQLNCRSGEVLRSAQSTLLRNSMTITQEGNTLRLKGSISAQNDLFRLPFDFDTRFGKRQSILTAPPIDYEWSLIVNLDNQTYEVSFAHDTFPSYELYVRVGHGPWRAIWRENPGTLGPLGLFSQIPGTWKRHSKKVVRLGWKSDSGSKLGDVKVSGKPGSQVMERAEARVRKAHQPQSKISNFLVRFVMGGGSDMIRNLRKDGWFEFKPADIPADPQAFSVGQLACHRLGGHQAQKLFDILFGQYQECIKICGDHTPDFQVERRSLNGNCNNVQIQTECTCYIKGV